MQDDLDTQLRRYYESQRLSADEVDRLAREGRTHSRWAWQAPWSWALAVMMVVAVAVTLVLPQSVNYSAVDMLTADISKNHLAGVPDDLPVRDIDSMAEQLAAVGLSFALPASRELQGQIVGARLCSLAGKPAVHIYLDDDGKQRSLFVSAASDALPDLTGNAGRVAELDIQTWSENGHFFALAENR